MAKDIGGVNFERDGDYAICHVESLSDDIKELIRSNLLTICHGSHSSDYSDTPLFNYESTLASFLERYKNKTDNTKKGMIGEFLSHILITELFDEFDVVSAFFNLEEKSIKKGFDLLLYKSLDSSVWITEVKSGNLHKNKTHDETTRDLLNTAKADLDVRLNTQETMYWINAVNSVRCSLNDEKDYKNALVKILITEGNAAALNKAKSNDNCVILVSNLFEPLDTRISKEIAKSFLEKTNEAKSFANTVVFCIQKETYSKVIDFLTSEIAGAIT
ncbi:MAG: SAVED domain-containing protein [Methylobacter sp.]|nr:SAVED domain-containing protein [Methylobacter sp.]